MLPQKNFFRQKLTRLPSGITFASANDSHENAVCQIVQYSSQRGPWLGTGKKKPFKQKGAGSARRGDFLSRLRVLIKRQGLSKEVFPELYDE